MKPCKLWDNLPYVSTGAGFLPSTVGPSLFSTESLTYGSKNQRSSPEQTFITSQYYWLIYSDFYRGTRSVGFSKWLTMSVPCTPNDFPLKRRHFMNLVKASGKPRRWLRRCPLSLTATSLTGAKKTWNIDLAKTRSNTYAYGYRCAFDKIHYPFLRYSGHG